ncbi:MAG: DNA-binding transcriptional regulator [Planctomycetia bacterium]|nr:DNA-binding transcriptional regulator [Planctomycetia bacterium]
MVTGKRQSPRILLLMGTSHGYGRELIDGITQYLFESGYRADFELRGHLEPIPPWVKHWRGDGVIVRHNKPETFAMLERIGIPYVKLNCPDHPSDVDIDEEALGEMAATHFAERGIRNFAFFTQCDHYWTRRRRDGFRRAVEKRGAVFHLFERHRSDTPPFLTWNRRERRQFTTWLHELPKPVGVLASYDFHARQVLDVCQSEGVSVPNEIAVLGVNNEEWFCRLQTPPLSSIIQCGRKAGYEAARILCAKIQGGAIPALPLLFPPVGVSMRQSTDLVAIDDEDAAMALHLLREGACEGITIDEIVTRVGLSRRTLERRFKTQFGRTLGEEMLRIRLARAREMLCDSDLPVGNIARRLGFCSHAYFNHVFRQEFGETPSGCRERFQVH